MRKPIKGQRSSRRKTTVDHDKSVLGLASIRRNRGLSLQQISANTKIGVRALQAIEEGDFKKLPGGIYNTSYIRQYARSIDFDESELLAYYHSKTDVPSEVPPINSEKKANLRDFRYLLQH
jgi:cytoskeletal protein RodZ